MTADYTQFDAVVRAERDRRPLPPRPRHEPDFDALADDTRAHSEGGREPNPYKLWTLDDLRELGPPSWRIVGVLPDDSFTLLFGPTGSLKSFVALDWSLCIASGIPWHGHRTHQGIVLYIAAEGGPGISRRADGWRKEHPDAHPGMRFRTLPHRVDLSDPGSIMRLRDTIEYSVACMDAYPAVIVIDTWSRNTPGVNENSSEDQSKLIDDVFDGMAKKYGVGVLVVHHSGLDSRRAANAAPPRCRQQRTHAGRRHGTPSRTVSPSSATSSRSGTNPTRSTSSPTSSTSTLTFTAPTTTATPPPSSSAPHNRPPARTTRTGGTRRSLRR